MVKPIPALNSRKRKAPSDMESPPKRVTRARAKASENPEPTLKTAKTKSTKAAVSAKLAAETKAPTNAVRVARKKNKLEAIDDATQDSTEAPQVIEPPKTRGRPKRVAEEAEAEAAEINAPKARTRQIKTITTDDVVEAPKPKGRARKQITANVESDPGAPTDNAVEPSKRSTRGRGAVASSKPTAVPPPKSATLRKRVTFEDDLQQNKENVPVAVETIEASKASALKTTGLKAKPVRKPAATRVSTREKRTNSSAIEGADKKIVKPLSPKKVTQVAKSNSTSSEDELGTEKTPPRPLARSPVKAPMSIARNITKEASIADSAAQAPTSPLHGLQPSIMASPARRPAPSPFKECLKEPPKRVNFELSLPQLSVDPKPTPLKASLLQSPARRPISPTKGSILSSPSKSSLAGPMVSSITTPKAASTFKLPAFPSGMLFNSPVRAARPLETPANIHTMTSAERQAQAQDITWSDEICTTTNEGAIGIDKMSPPSEHLAPKSPSPTQRKVSEVVVEDSDMFWIDTKDPGKLVGHMDAKEEETRAIDFKVERRHEVAAVYRHYRQAQDDSDSEDELQSSENTGMSSPQKYQRITAQNFGAAASHTPAAFFQIPESTGGLKPKQQIGCNQLPTQTPVTQRSELPSITPLVAQLSSWMASSPEKTDCTQRDGARYGIFSPIGPTLFQRPDQLQESNLSAPPVHSTFFDEEMIVRDQEAFEIGEEKENNEKDYTANAEACEALQASQEYGDENAMPIDPALLNFQYVPQPMTGTVTPAKIFRSNPREIHTVSKVPLRAAADDSPLMVPRKRSRSVSSPLADVTQDSVSMSPLGRGNTGISYGCEEIREASGMMRQGSSPAKSVPAYAANTAYPMTPSAEPFSTAGTPFKPARVGADAQILRGAVVYVNVHTTEGADASGIFIELLTQMGAKCVKQWNWNPSTSVAGPSTPGPSESIECTTSAKVGITHVVFKDGGRRTLQKVRESKGLVLCVGVGWVLDCERENKWLDEAEYAVDTSTIPRGGHNRRKSMEPRSLANINGNLVPVETPAKTSSDMSPSKEFLNFGSPVPRLPAIAPTAAAPETPRPGIIFDDDASAWGSPTTPYFLSKGAALVQKTCPPKQTMQPLFPLSGMIQDQPDEAVRQRLLLARRKSLQWAPKVGSPLGRAMNCGKDDTHVE